MHVISAWLAGTLISIVSTVIGRIMLTLGIGVFSYVGLNTSLYIFKNYFIDSLGSAGFGLINVAGMLKLDICLSMLLAVGLAKFAIKTSNSVSFRQLKLF